MVPAALAMLEQYRAIHHGGGDTVQEARKYAYHEMVARVSKSVSAWLPVRLNTARHSRDSAPQ